MNEELKSCPFCGGKAKIEKWDSERWFTHCPRCNINTTPYGKRDNAIAAWNCRTTQKIEPLTLDALLGV